MSSSSEGGRKTTTYRTFFGQHRVWSAVVALAAQQHTVVSLPQLTELGFPASTVRSRAAAARLHRIHQGVYSLVPRRLLTPRGHWMAAVLAFGPHAVLSHRTAAALHGLRPSARTGIDVMIPRRSGRRRRGIDLHRSITLASEDITAVDGIPCTTIARTLLDLAAVASRRSLERAFDQWEVMQEFDLNAVTDQLARNPMHHGARAVKAILEEHYIGSTVTASELEEAVFAICRRALIPQPQVNRWIDFGDGGPMIKADFVWPEQRVILECDGHRFHGTRQARERDTRRDQRAITAGWRPIRTTWRQVERRPAELESTLVRLVRAPRPGQRPQPPPGREPASQQEPPPAAAA